MHKISNKAITSSQSNLTKAATRTVQSYSPGGANIHPHVTHASLGPSESTTQTASLRFSHFCTAHHRASIYFTTGCPFSLQNCPFSWEIWIPIQYMIPWDHPSPKPKRHLDQFSHFCRAHDCDRQTDRQTTLLGL